MREERNTSVNLEQDSESGRKLFRHPEEAMEPEAGEFPEAGKRPEAEEHRKSGKTLKNGITPSAGKAQKDVPGEEEYPYRLYFWPWQ